jgi:hypothetical protein
MLTPETLRRALLDACAIDVQDARFRALSTLADPLATLPAELLYPIWQDAMWRLARRSRSHLLSDMQALAPAMAVLSPSHVSTDVIMIIAQVRRWWP